jgi:phospholipid/cholesterol/gamma-HCH transport system substrate-binding protein
VIDLTGLAATLNAGSSTIDGVLQRLPTKVATLTRTATYGSWFNFYTCSLGGTVTLPGNLKVNPSLPLPAARCG